MMFHVDVRLVALIDVSWTPQRPDCIQFLHPEVFRILRENYSKSPGYFRIF